MQTIVVEEPFNNWERKPLSAGRIRAISIGPLKLDSTGTAAASNLYVNFDKGQAVGAYVFPIAASASSFGGLYFLDQECSGSVWIRTPAGPHAESSITFWFEGDTLPNGVKL